MKRQAQPDRDSQTVGPNRGKDSASPWPKRGLAGKTSAAVRHAPDGADDLQILSVGYRAWQDGRDVSDVWEEVLADD